ncbi:hypothetical protein Btru_063602 [Bulinus truncatus]|nr:hypothetical protein Btru_063602 [Bulinus truncatus]
MAKLGLAGIFFLLFTCPLTAHAYWRELGGAVGGGILAAGVVSGLVAVPIIGPMAAAYGSVKVGVIIVGVLAGANRANDSRKC